ncbi:MAG: 30S ribosomal protein S17, partial [Planctomycetes bacterium]|nr:30S ribosomal protein S17 [Planctomycetota bacterium]
EGDFVEIMGVRPMSKTKRWRLVKVLEAAQN